MTHDETHADESSATTEADLETFRTRLQELQANGSNVLVVGDQPREIFTRASAVLLGAPEGRRYRLLAVTDARAESVADRLPTDAPTTRQLADTTKLINHALPPRALTDSHITDLTPLPEQRVTDPDLAGLQSALVNAMAEFDRRAGGLAPLELRVGLDSFNVLADYYPEAVVREFLRTVTDRVREYAGLAHYVLIDGRGSDPAQCFRDEFDALLELRAVDATTHTVEQRWRFLDTGFTIGWAPLTGEWI